MRHAASRCRFSLVGAVVLAVLSALSLLLLMWITGPVSPVNAGGDPLVITVDRPLTLVDEAVSLVIDGKLSRSLQGAQLVIRVKGPARSSEIDLPDPDLPEVDKMLLILGEDSEGSGSSGESSAEGAVTTGVQNLGTSADLAAGLLRVEVAVPSGMPASPGAYLLVAEVRSSGMVIASGQAWIGKAALRDAPLDLAFVWPVSLGIHRDPDGAFYDSVLQEAVSPGYENSGDLRELLTLSDRFSWWDFTLAVEPVLLTQLRDMSDGYTCLDTSGIPVELGANDLSAVHAAEVLSVFESLGSNESVDIVVSPYSNADLGLLAGEGWRDGLEQILMGKQEVLQSLGLETPPQGAYSPGLDLTTDSLAYYAGASIDHVIVDEALMDRLTEPVAGGTVAVRARDADNDRLTLVFADSLLAAHMAASWDTGKFAAALAAELATAARDAIVVTPSTEFTLVPEAFLEGIGEMLEGLAWVRTQTVTELLRTYAPDTRPILLNTAAGETQGYIQESLLEGVRSAHTAVSNLAAVADITRAPVEAAHRLLYMAESRWWSRSNTSPYEASIGLRYAEQARLLAQAELDKVSFIEDGSSVIMGNEGMATLVVENEAEYPISVDLSMAGEGVVLPEGELVEVELEPGRNKIQVKVAKTSGIHRLEAVLLAGNSTLDQIDRSFRFVTAVTVLPWATPVLLAVAAGMYLLTRRLRKRPAARI